MKGDLHHRWRFWGALSLALLFAFPQWGWSAKKPPPKKYHYTYLDREDHTAKETLTYLGLIHALGIGLYYVTQPDTIRQQGSFEKYGDNFGKIVLFDKDDPFWNWLVHPYSGSQIFLFYRANGYKRWEAFKLAAVQSLLFEFTIEIYTEPASFEDMFNTPVLGSALGILIEKGSMALLNSGTWFGSVLGHALNPSTLFNFYEGQVALHPTVGKNGPNGFRFSMEF